MKIKGFSILICLCFSAALFGCGQESLPGEYVGGVNGEKSGILLVIKNDRAAEFNGAPITYDEKGPSITLVENGKPVLTLNNDGGGVLSGTFMGFPIVLKKK